jgi:hypothetical protein
MSQAMLLRTPTRSDQLMRQRAQPMQRTTHGPTPCAAIVPLCSVTWQPLQAQVATAAASHQHRRGRRASTACSARKPAVAPGKVEEAAAVAAGAYQGLSIFWQVSSNTYYHHILPGCLSLLVSSNGNACKSYIDACKSYPHTTTKPSFTAVQATLRLLGVTVGAIIASNLVIRLLNWAAEDVGDVRMPTPAS